MTVPSERALLRDIAKLLTKHPLEEWEQLIVTLADEQRRQQVIEAIRAIMVVARPKRGADNSRRGDTAVKWDELRKSEPEKAELLGAFRQGLLEKRLLPTAQTVREFAAIAGLKQTLPSRREQAISQLIIHLSGLSIPELKQVLRQRVRGARDLGAEYERWVELILDRKGGRS